MTFTQTFSQELERVEQVFGVENLKMSSANTWKYGTIWNTECLVMDIKRQCHVLMSSFFIFLQHNVRGVVAMANNGPNTNASQFYFVYAKQPHLDMKYTVFGKYVVSSQIYI